MEFKYYKVRKEIKFQGYIDLTCLCSLVIAVIFQKENLSVTLTADLRKYFSSSLPCCVIKMEICFLTLVALTHFSHCFVGFKSFSNSALSRYLVLRSFKLISLKPVVSR